MADLLRNIPEQGIWILCSKCVKNSGIRKELKVKIVQNNIGYNNKIGQIILDRMIDEIIQIQVLGLIVHTIRSKRRTCNEYLPAVSRSYGMW
jgi:hypothetical protein